MEFPLPNDGETLQELFVRDKKREWDNSTKRLNKTRTSLENERKRKKSVIVNKTQL